MVLPVLDAINIFSLPITAFKKGGSYDINNRWVDGPPQADFTFSGSFQPLSGRDQQFLPEGEDLAGSSVLFTATELDIIDNTQAAGQNPDQTFIKSGNDWWIVVGISDWDAHAAFNKYICVKFLGLE